MDEFTPSENLDKKEKKTNLFDIDYVEEELFSGNFDIVYKLDADFIRENLKTIKDAISYAIANESNRKEILEYLYRIVHSETINI